MHPKVGGWRRNMIEMMHRHHDLETLFRNAPRYFVPDVFKEPPSKATGPSTARSEVDGDESRQSESDSQDMPRFGQKLTGLADALKPIIFHYLVTYEKMDRELLPISGSDAREPWNPIYRMSRPMEFSDAFLLGLHKFLFASRTTSRGDSTGFSATAGLWDAVAGEIATALWVDPLHLPPVLSWSPSIILAGHGKNGYIRVLSSGPAASVFAPVSMADTATGNPHDTAHSNSTVDRELIFLLLKRTFAAAQKKFINNADHPKAMISLLSRLASFLEETYDWMDRCGRYHLMVFFVIFFVEWDAEWVIKLVQTRTTTYSQRHALYEQLRRIYNQLQRLLDVRYDPLVEHHRYAKQYLFDVISNTVRRRLQESLSAAATIRGEI